MSYLFRHPHRRFLIYPSLPDVRDFLYEADPRDKLQEKVDLREQDSPVENQYFLGSCVGNAVVNAYENMVRDQYPDQFVDLSRLFVYYNARLELREEMLDEGTTVKLGVKSLEKYGVCSEKIWPYDPEMFDDRPSMEAYNDARKRRITEYRKLNSQQNILHALSNRKPVVFGIDVFNSFMNLNQSNYRVALPEYNDLYLGGHAMCLVGYDLDNRFFIAKNSFGVDWGDQGYCQIPFKYFAYYSYDIWTFDIPARQEFLLETRFINFRS